MVLGIPILSKKNSTAFVDDDCSLSYNGIISAFYYIYTSKYVAFISLVATDLVRD